MKIFPLHQGLFFIGQDKKFISLKENVDAPLGAMTIAIQPFLIKKSDDEYILLDAGLEGTYLGQGKPDLIYLLEKNGVQLSQVKRIIISHLHYDHFSGMFDAASKAFLFQKASVVIYKNDFEDCIQKNRYPQFTQPLKYLAEKGNIIFLDEEKGYISEEITYFHTGAHMPFHIVFHIKVGNTNYFYGGDEAPQLSQMKVPLIAKYDFDGKKASQLRQQWYAQGQQEGWSFLFYHDVKQAIMDNFLKTH